MAVNGGRAGTRAAAGASWGVDDELWVRCPYCHESQLLYVDPETAGSFVQDCDVCCRPWQVFVERDADGALSASVSRAQ